MGWFDKQIKLREQNDIEQLAEAFASITSSVVGHRISTILNDNKVRTKEEVERVIKYFRYKPVEVPDDITDANEQLDYMLRPHGILRREVKFENGWYKHTFGPYLCVKKETGQLVTLLPSGLSGYYYFDENEKKVKINRKNQYDFEEEAIAFYQPFPIRKMGLMDVIKFTAASIGGLDYILFGLATIGVTALGMITPKLNQIVFSSVVESDSSSVVIAMTIFMVCLSLSTLIITTVKNLLLNRINTKMSASVSPAAMIRVLALHPSFFKKLSAGEIMSRLQYLKQLSDSFLSVVLTTGLTSIFSLVYITQIFEYAPPLVTPALLVILVTIAFTTLSALIQMRVSKRAMELQSKKTGMEYSLISGVQKLKISGAENRAFAQWGKLFAKSSELIYNPPLILKLNTVITAAISLVGTIVMYYLSVKNSISIANYYAFFSAYGMVSGAFMALSGIALTIAQIKPILAMVKPILDAEPESFSGAQVVSKLTGNIELSNVSFAYDNSSPEVIKNMNLKIKAGQYVAIVGSTGCGKSTLMRLILGFENPTKGAIYFDGKDAAKMDRISQRQCLGVVLQDGKLFQGNIYSNIVISAPHLSIDQAWEAAEIAGIAEDIRKMPMGMHTIISEGSGGISGGQRQRLMIARAIAPKPKILMLDEATSALDNLTQKQVSDALAKLKCTRIVIAHRLSTIKQCDRILVLENGNISEEGTYDELIALGGSFAKLIERQRVDL